MALTADTRPGHITVWPVYTHRLDGAELLNQVKSIDVLALTADTKPGYITVSLVYKHRRHGL